jgi:CheY-specific phosphatase CheX
VGMPSAQFFKPFIDGTRHVLEASCNLHAKPGKPYLVSDGEGAALEVDISGVVALDSRAFKGFITIALPEATFLGMIFRMTGEQHSRIAELDEDLKSGASELMNMIFGHAKAILSEQGQDLHKAIPTLAYGRRPNVGPIHGAKSLLLPFEAEVGPFHIEFCCE